MSMKGQYKTIEVVFVEENKNTNEIGNREEEYILEAINDILDEFKSDLWTYQLFHLESLFRNKAGCLKNYNHVLEV